MKNSLKYMAGVFIAGVAMAACSPEEFTGANGNIPQTSDYADNFKVTVDQVTNYASFEFISAPGITPVWIIDGASYSSAFSFSKYYRKKGSYTVECKVKNANGISDGIIAKTFVVEKTKMNGFGGFVEDSDYNLFKGLELPDNPGNNDNPAHNPAFWYAPGWNMIDAPNCVLSKGAYTVTLPVATTDQWQAQMAIYTGLAITADKHYDFSVIMTSTKAHNNVKVKICKADDDDVILMDRNFALEAGEPKALFGSDMEIYSSNPDTHPVTDFNNTKIVFDFGGNVENTEITIESFVLKDHADDDGTVVPDEEIVPEPTWSAVDSPDNLWYDIPFTVSYYYATGDGWSSLPNPTLVVSGTEYSIILPEASTQRWQCQVALLTEGLELSADENYDFRVTFIATADIPGATIKLVQDGDDALFVFESQKDLPADEETVFKAINKSGKDITKTKLVFDFGGNPANTTVIIKDVILQKH